MGFVVVSPGYFAGVRMEFVEIAPIEEVRNGFWIDGSLDMITAPDVRRFMEDVPPGPLVLDLARVKFLDTVGLYLLLRLSERSEESPSLIIRNPSQAVRRVLRICHPDGIPYVEVQSAGTDTVAGAATAGLA